MFVGYPKVMFGYSSITLKTKVFVVKNVKFLEKEFLWKIKWEDNRTLIRLLNLSYIWLELRNAGKFPDAAIMFMDPMSQRLKTRRSKFLLNRVGRIWTRIVRFEIKSLLFDNDESTTCKEAVMGPDSIDLLEAMEIRDKFIYEKPSLWTWKTLWKAWSLLIVFGSINKQTWMFYIYEIVGIL